MSYNSKSLLKDQENKPIPQIYDRANDAYIPVEKMEYYGKSTDTKPMPAKTPIGATYLEFDTKKVYLNTGTTWELF